MGSTNVRVGNTILEGGSLFEQVRMQYIFFRPRAPLIVRSRRAVASRASHVENKSNASVALALGAFASATFAFPLWYCYARANRVDAGGESERRRGARGRS